MMPFPAMQGLFDPFFPKGLQWYWKGDFVESLSDEAIQALDEYLTATKDFPPPKTKSVPAWNAAVTEMDFRAQVLNQDIGLEQQPQLVLRIYPKEMMFLDEMDEKCFFQITQEGRDYFEQLRRFIDLAYPR